MTLLYDWVDELVSVEPNDLDLRAVRSLQKDHSDELGHIKTTGKGRTKAAIIKDLRQWLNTEFTPDPDGLYEINDLVSDNLIKVFLVKKHHRFVQKLRREFEKNGWFSDWEDVERRVNGFSKTMVTEHNECWFRFEKQTSFYWGLWRTKYYEKGQ